MISSRPFSSLGVSVGSLSVFSWKTNAESKATISSGSRSASTFSSTSSVRTSSSAEWICETLGFLNQEKDYDKLYLTGNFAFQLYS